MPSNVILKLAMAKVRMKANQLFSQVELFPSMTPCCGLC